MELTITQNGALYYAHHKAQISKHRAARFWPLRTRASKQDGQDIRGLKSGDETGSNVIETHDYRGDFSEA
jgi:hypothetical protein